MAAVPSIGRATRVEGATPPEADLTRALYEAYANQIFRYCLHQLGSREEAEDAVQSTFLNAFRGLKRGVVPELEAAWLFKIAHNVCLSRRRSSWRRERVESPADFQVVEELTPVGAVVLVAGAVACGGGVAVDEAEEGLSTGGKTFVSLRDQGNRKPAGGATAAGSASTCSSTARDLC